MPWYAFRGATDTAYLGLGAGALSWLGQPCLLSLASPFSLAGVPDLGVERVWLVGGGGGGAG